VCDLVVDCTDGSDEAACSNHFMCKSNGNFIPKTKLCDKVFDCMDLSDECDPGCSNKRILDRNFLKVASWIIGTLAILANMVTILKTLRILKRCKTSVAFTNNSLVIAISLGDFMVGCYLFVISVYDGIIFKSEFCKQQIDWITSAQCSTLGVLSSIGSQVSLFSMTALSIIRSCGIVSSDKMRVPGEVTLIKCIAALAAVVGMTLASTAIAIIPIVEKVEDFFVNGVKFADGLAFFIGTVGKPKLTNVVEVYYGKMKNESLSWRTLNAMVAGMFSHDYEYRDLTEDTKMLGFYGNDGVCLFKYFVNNDDPQRIFVWSILALNFICFFCILCSYLLIGFTTHRSSKSLSKSSNNRNILRRNRRMNRRIFLIITTDFLCWVPFIVLCVLHSNEVLNATSWYSVVSMIVLPINSVINPFLYEEAFIKFISYPVGRLSRVISAIISGSVPQ
jgi:hypothetical protein